MLSTGSLKSSVIAVGLFAKALNNFGGLLSLLIPSIEFFFRPMMVFFFQSANVLHGFLVSKSISKDHDWDARIFHCVNYFSIALAIEIRSPSLSSEGKLEHSMLFKRRQIG